MVGFILPDHESIEPPVVISTLTMLHSWRCILSGVLYVSYFLVHVILISI